MIGHQISKLSDEQIEQKAHDILKKMTLTEKLNQMQGDHGIFPHGLFMLIRYNSKPIPAGKNKRLGIPAMNFTDGPRGIVMNNSTCFPVSMARGATWDVELEEKIGDIIGIEARAQGANYFGGVCINLLRHPAWGRAQETYGEDPVHLGEMGSALVRGSQKHVMACAKHFAANSMENARFKINIQMNERVLREIYLPHFKKCVENGVDSIMSAYNKVNDAYCGHNKHLLRDILKNDWKFDGFVVSDFFWGIRDAEAGVLGGLDIEMPFKYRMKPKTLKKLFKTGKIKEEHINDAVLRILHKKIGQMRRPSDEKYSIDQVACPAHIKISLEAARKSITLLKNENNILPLKRNEIKKIAIIGRLGDFPNIGDHGSSRVYPPYVITPYQGIKKLAGSEIKVLKNNGEDIESAKKLAKDADIVILVVGFTKEDEGEFMNEAKKDGGDRDSLKLRPEAELLIKEMSEINPKTIVIMEGGSAVITENWRNDVPGIVMAWYPGMEGGTALGDILFGDVNPSGKLPCIFPKSSKQLPYFDKNADSIIYDFYHGYNLMDKKGYEPAFAFGFGLSYTTFLYRNLLVNKRNIDKDGSVIVTLDVSNTGDFNGDEIVQMYVGYKNSAIERHLKDLKGFKRIFLKSGETKSISLEMKAKDLAYYDLEAKGWKVEEIEYIVYVGPSSKLEDLLTTSFSISS